MVSRATFSELSLEGEAVVGGGVGGGPSGGPESVLSVQVVGSHYEEHRK